MAIWFAEDSKTRNAQAELRADNTSDVADLADFATVHNLKPGTTCVIQGSSSVYAMQSDGTFVKM